MPDAILDESPRIRRLRASVDLASAILRGDESLTPAEAERVVDAARTTALSLFPDGGPQFELIVAPRLRRIIRERGLVSA